MVGANAKIRRFAGFVVLAGFPLTTTRDRRSLGTKDTKHTRNIIKRDKKDTDIIKNGCKPAQRSCSSL
jgi:hypothetical protein